MQIGVHLVQRWCRRQPVIALSSGEAELDLDHMLGPCCPATVLVA